MTDRPRKGQQGRPLPAAKRAAAIAHAEHFGNVAAAKKFGVATRTIEAYRSAHRAGKTPEVSALVEQFSLEAARKQADLLGDTLEKTLKRIQKLLPDATLSECTKVAETLGDLTIQRDFIGGSGGHESPAHPRKDSAARAAQGRAGGTESQPTDSAVH
jgi:hypothetical protein